MGPVYAGFRTRRLTNLAKCKLVPPLSNYMAPASGNKVCFKVYLVAILIIIDVFVFE